jgi:hypothetical protein
MGPLKSTGVASQEQSFEKPSANIVRQASNSIPILCQVAFLSLTHGYPLRANAIAADRIGTILRLHSLPT